MPGLEEKSKTTFGGHEKFVFRQGWLKKGVDAVSENPAIFADDQALVTLGVGKNMVRSIRHWCLATGLVEETLDGSRIRPLAVSELGKRLFASSGWDPYLEDMGTIWLLHWQLATNRQRALIWHLLFSRFYEAEFTKRQFGAFVTKQLEIMGIMTTPGTIEREIDCCLLTYVPASQRRTSIIVEESLDCPLVDLDLVRYSQEDNLYSFHSGPKPSLPTAIFGYGLIRFLNAIAQNRRTVHVDECVYHENSPGQIFRLDENSVVEYLEDLEALTDGAIRMQESAGLPQVYLSSLSEQAW
ncbi:MAG: DUF4007 family protein, partial [Caldilinea sp.]